MVVQVKDCTQRIGHSWTDATGGERMEIRSPADGQLLATVPRSTQPDVDAAVLAAQRAAPGWAQTPPSERAAALIALADALEKNIDHLTALESANGGKPIRAARGEVVRSADRLRFFAGAARCAHGLASGEYVRGATSWVRREPLGVVASILPWNYPLHMAAWKIGPILAAGNTCVIKPSQLTPLTALELARLAENIIPPGVLNVICGDAIAGAALARHPGVAMITLTGSVDTGRAVARAAADSIKRVHLELGGKAPAVVLSDADPAIVASRLRAGAFWNAGQDCTAAARVLVCDEVFDDVVSALLSETSRLKVGNPADPDTEMGPLISATHCDRVRGFLQRATHAQILCGGGDGGRGPAYLEPTVVTGVNQSDEIVQSEIFGPVITLQRVESEEQALRLANDVAYGLAASVWTSNVDRAMRAARSLNFGTVWINEHGPIASEMPFGGFAASGYGTDLSVYAVEGYTRIKHVMLWETT